MQSLTLAPGVPLGIEEIRQMAEAVAASKLFPSIDTTVKAFTLMMLCQAEGLHPMLAVRRYHIINGVPSLKSDAMLASFQATGGRVKWIRSDESICEAEFSGPGSEPVPVKWTQDDVSRAGIGGNQTHKRYPRQMLRARVISEGVRMVMPEVVVGIYTPEEVSDFDAAPKYTPPSPAQKIQAGLDDARAYPEGDDSKGRVANAAVPKISPATLKRLQTMFDKADIKDRADKLKFCTSVTGVEIESSRDLTEAQALLVIEGVAMYIESTKVAT